MGDLSPATGLPDWAKALAATLTMQTTAALATRVLPVLGPAVTAAAGVPAESIGHVAAAGALGTMWFLMSGSPLLARFGPIRLLQAGGVLGTLALVLATTGFWPLLLMAAFLIGVAYGPSPPAGSDILNRHAPSGHRSLVFSIKQSGVPLGGAMAGLLAPAAAGLWGWQTGLLTAAAVVGASVLAVQPLRAGLDAGRRRDEPAAPGTVFAFERLVAPFRALRLAPGMPALTAAGFAFAMVQGAVFSFYVTFLTADLGFGLVAAGAAFALMQGVGVGSRVVVGWVADRIGSARRTLTLLALGSATMATVIAFHGADWPWPAVLAAAAVSGVAVSSWNGVYLAEVARIAPSARVGEATAGSSFFAFLAYAVSPSLCSVVIASTGSYRTAFLMVAAAPLGAALLLGRIRGG
ncbi:MAG: MFS transporter [Alphaproteobacteria bacterium]|nr:MFS transporter [Alphaproteobacteria bacterium]